MPLTIPLTARQVAQIGIVAHTSRIPQASRLCDMVDAAVMCIDDGTLGCEGNHFRVWEQLSDADTPWCVVLEDDAVPVADFTSQLVGVLRNAPAPIVSLYLGRSRPPAWQNWAARVTAKANASDDCFIPCARLLHGVGVAIHRRLIPDMLTQTRDLGLPIDEAITAWARWNRYQIVYSWPSIVDHLDIPTLIDHRDGKPRDQPRIAWHVGSRSHWHWRPV